MFRTLGYEVSFSHCLKFFGSWAAVGMGIEGDEKSFASDDSGTFGT